MNAFRDTARKAGRDPAKLQIVARVNARPDAPAPAPRPPLVGAMEQIAEDFARLRGLGVNHVFFDMNFAGTPADEQLRLLAPLRKAFG